MFYLSLIAQRSYPTSDSWLPPTDMSLPIHINKMDNMRWGKNWGSFERMDWCNDVDVETVSPSPHLPLLRVIGTTIPVLL